MILKKSDHIHHRLNLFTKKIRTHKQKQENKLKNTETNEYTHTQRLNTKQMFYYTGQRTAQTHKHKQLRST